MKKIFVLILVVTSFAQAQNVQWHMSSDTTASPQGNLYLQTRGFTITRVVNDTTFQFWNGTEYLSVSGASGTPLYFEYPLQARGTAASDTVNLDTTAANGAATKPYVFNNTRQVLNIEAFGAVGNDTTDCTSALQAAIDSAISLGGGIVYVPQGTFKVGGEIRLPNTSGFNIRLTGTSRETRTSVAGSVLNMVSDTGNAHIQSFPLGTFEIDHIYFRDSGSDTLPFIYSNFTTMLISGNTFVGHSQKNVAWLGGGNGNQINYNLPDSCPFSGYGSIFRNNFIDSCGIAIYGRYGFNGVQIVDNTIWSHNTGLAAIEINGNVLNGNGGNFIAGNLIELVNYYYGIYLANTNNNSMTANSFFDPGTNFKANILISANSTHDVQLGAGYSGDVVDSSASFVGYTGQGIEGNPIPLVTPSGNRMATLAASSSHSWLTLGSSAGGNGTYQIENSSNNVVGKFGTANIMEYGSVANIAITSPGAITLASGDTTTIAGANAAVVFQAKHGNPTVLDTSGNFILSKGYMGTLLGDSAIATEGFAIAHGGAGDSLYFEYPLKTTAGSTTTNDTAYVDTSNVSPMFTKTFLTDSALTAGSNITITKTGLGRVTIASTGGSSSSAYPDTVLFVLNTDSSVSNTTNYPLPGLAFTFDSASTYLINGQFFVNEDSANTGLYICTDSSSVTGTPTTFTRTVTFISASFSKLMGFADSAYTGTFNRNLGSGSAMPAGTCMATLQGTIETGSCYGTLKFGFMQYNLNTRQAVLIMRHSWVEIKKIK